jgi:hypothetical protein
MPFIHVTQDPGNDFFITNIEDVTWDAADFNWDNFYADKYYSYYIYETFGVNVPAPYGVLWDHAVILTVVLPGSNGSIVTSKRKKRKTDKKEKEKIRLIFMVDDFADVFEKEKNNEVKVKMKFKEKVENILTERFNQQVILEDVQIIHG